MLLIGFHARSVSALFLFLLTTALTHGHLHLSLRSKVRCRQSYLSSSRLGPLSALFLRHRRTRLRRSSHLRYISDCVFGASCNSLRLRRVLPFIASSALSHSAVATRILLGRLRRVSLYFTWCGGETGIAYRRAPARLNSRQSSCSQQKPLSASQKLRKYPTDGG